MKKEVIKKVKKPRKKASEKAFNYDVKEDNEKFEEFKKLIEKGCKINEKELKNSDFNKKT